MQMNFELPAISDTRKLRSPYEGNSAAGAVIRSKVPWVLMNPSNNRPIMLRYFKAFSSNVCAHSECYKSLRHA
ncbi:hypothetical protein Tco_0280161 [Tanacetum coccineum]